MLEKNFNKKLISLTESALRVRGWESKNLPIAQSALALELFLVIAYNTTIGKPLTLKLLFYSIGFSETGIRKHLRRLINDGWCSLEGATHDKRLRHVVAKPKMIEALKNYGQVLQDEFVTRKSVSSARSKNDSSF